MRNLLLATVAALTLAALPALSALHKCTTSQGKTIYTEFECEGDAKKGEVTIRDSSGFDGTKVAPAKPAAGAGSPKSGATPANEPAKKRAPDPVAEAEERARALAAEEKAKAAEKAKQEKQDKK